ncbi:SecDF P1 head subdomain-containing protein [Pelistega ratti]|nr:hypothetical protein [Pelistega ratti]
MRFNRLLIGLGLATTLVGCQAIDRLMGITPSTPSSLPSNIPSAPPPDLPTKPATTATSTKVKSSLVIYVGSTNPISGYTQVQQKGRTVYVDPRQTLLYSDLSNAIAVVDENNRPYVDLAFSPAGTKKLAQLTGRNIGKNLIVTFKNELISIMNIDAQNTRNILHVPMQSVSDAQTLERRILDGE